jgi:large subunit ribosomal protein L35
VAVPNGSSVTAGVGPVGHKIKETEMPKLKTKSGAKKRFKFTAKGKIKTGQAGKRHRLISNTPERTRTLRGTSVLSDSETQRIKRWMPYV